MMLLNNSLISALRKVSHIRGSGDKVIKISFVVYKNHREYNWSYDGISIVIKYIDEV